MMTDVFLKLLNMNIAASWVVLAVIVFRAQPCNVGNGCTQTCDSVFR